MNDNNCLVSILKTLIELRKDITDLSGACDLAKLSDFLDETDFDIAKAIRNLKQAIKLVGKRK